LSAEYWYSFECPELHDGAGPVLFEVRTRNDNFHTARCPVMNCGRGCAAQDYWEADKNGYGSTSDAERALSSLADMILLRRKGKS
jgi:hypothetical protein